MLTQCMWYSAYILNVLRAISMYSTPSQRTPHHLHIISNPPKQTRQKTHSLYTPESSTSLPN